MTAHKAVICAFTAVRTSFTFSGFIVSYTLVVSCIKINFPRVHWWVVTSYMCYNQLSHSVLPIWISWNINSISVIIVPLFSQFRSSPSISHFNNIPRSLKGIFIPMWDKEHCNFLYSLIFIRSKFFQSACSNVFTLHHLFTFRHSDPLK